MYIIKKLDLNKIFNILMFILIGFFLIKFFNDPEGSQKNIFLLKCKNLFGDFFNNLIYTSEKNPYFNTTLGFGEKAYLPLSYLIYYFFAKFDNFSSMDLDHATRSTGGILGVVIFSIISIIFLFHSISKLNNNKEFNIVQTIIILFSGITLFSIERGNLIIITASLVIYFLAFHESKSKNERIFSLISLCFAVVLKGYPVIFGMLLLKKSQFKSIFFCVFLTLIISFAPFIFFKNGFNNIPQFFNNFLENGDQYNYKQFFPRFGLPHLVFCISKFLKLNNNVDLLILLSRFLIYALTVFTLYIFFKEKDKWKSIAFLTIILIQIPINSALYTGMYFFPVIILFFKSFKTPSILNYIYVFLFVLFLNPFQISINFNNYQLSINSFISNISILIFWVSLLSTSIIKKNEKFSNYSNIQ
jgi:hypothetical protein